MSVKNGAFSTVKSLLFLLVLSLYISCDIATPVLSQDLANKQLRPSGLKTNPFRHRQPLPIRSTDEEDDNDDQPSNKQDTTSRKKDELPLLGGSTLFVLPLQRKSLPQSWCKARQFQQKIHHIGCKPVYITNSMCFGQCLSFFIPKHFISCSSCLPKEKYTKVVQLTCADRTQPLVKTVTVVKSCYCQACERAKTFL